MTLASEVANQRFRVGDLVVDAADASVRRSTERLVLPPRTFELLLALLRRYPGLVRRTELLDSVWQHEHVTDQTLSHRVMVLRKALGDHADHPVYVAGERGFGYRLIAPVERLDPPAGGPPPPSAHGWSAAALRRATAAALTLAVVGVYLAWRPAAAPSEPHALATVAVRPVAVSSELRPLSTELDAAIAAGLRRIEGLRVVKWDEHRPPDLRVETRWEGTAAALRLGVRVFDGAGARPVWSGDYEGGGYDVLDREGQIARAVAGGVHAHVAPLAPPPPDDVRVPIGVARQVLRAEALWYCWTRESLQESARAWAAAAAGAPGLADAHAGAAMTEAIAALLGYSSPGDAAGRARAHLRRAAELDEGLPATRLAAGLVRLLFDGDTARADALIRPAVADPAEDARGPTVLAVLALAEGRFDEAERLTETPLVHDPRATSTGLLHARALEGRANWAGAAAAYGRVLEEAAGLAAARVGRAACLARAGRPRQALATLDAGAASGGLPAGVAVDRLRQAWARLCRDPDLTAPERPRACLAASEPDAARAELRRAVQQRAPHAVLAARDPVYASLGAWSGDTNARRP